MSFVLRLIRIGSFGVPSIISGGRFEEDELRESSDGPTLPLTELLPSRVRAGSGRLPSPCRFLRESTFGSLGVIRGDSSESLLIRIRRRMERALRDSPAVSVRVKGGALKSFDDELPMNKCSTG